MADKTETAAPEEKTFSFKESFGYSEEPAEHAQKGAGTFGGEAISAESLHQNNDWLKAVANLYESKEHLNVASTESGITVMGEDIGFFQSIKFLMITPSYCKKLPMATSPP